jgi:hypothetical protein
MIKQFTQRLEHLPLAIPLQFNFRNLLPEIPKTNFSSLPGPLRSQFDGRQTSIIHDILPAAAQKQI